MLRNGRTGNDPETSFSKAIVAFTIIAAAGLAGCSADVMRFDAPALGYNGAGSERRTADADPGQTLFDQTPPASGGRDGGFEPRRTATTGSVTRSELPRVARTAEPPSSAPAAPPAARPPANTYPLEPDQRRRTAFNAPRRTVPRSPAEAPQTIVVQQGDTLYRISRAYNVPIANIKAANGLTSNVIKPGQRLVLRNGGEVPPTRARYALEPDRGAAPRTPVAPVTAAPVTAPPVTTPPATASGTTYVMRPGDSLYAVARRNGLKVATLMELNGISDARHVRAGTVLRLGPGGAPAAAPGEPAATPTRTASADAGRYATPGAAPAQPTIINGRDAPSTRRVKSVSVPITQPQTPPSTPAAPPTAEAERPAPPTLGDGKFRWPVRGRIVKNFGMRSDGTKNDGVDIAVPFGTEIHAAESGVVAYAGDELKGYGNLVLIRHDNGFVTAYAHNDQLLVKRGDTVRRGQVIAKAGKTGNVKQPMLHFELRQGAKPVNPLPHLAQL